MYCSTCGTEAGNAQKFCSSCGNALDGGASAIGQQTGDAQSRDFAKVTELRAKLSELEAKLPTTNVLNAKFWPRAFAVLGHNLAAILVIYAARVPSKSQPDEAKDAGIRLTSAVAKG